MPRAVVPPNTTVTDAPDLTGWKDAQDRLRRALGQPITFKIPIAKTYDPSIQLDADTGAPYDPTVVPTSGGGWTEIEKICVVVFQPIRVSQIMPDPTMSGPSGVRKTEAVSLIMDPSDYPDVEDAAEAVVNGVNYKITEITPDGLVDTDRYIVFLEAR